MTIKAIFFDIGNVLLAFDWIKAVKLIGERCALSPQQIGDRLRKSRIDAYERNLISTHEFFSDQKDKVRFDGTVDELTHIASDIFLPLDRNIELARDLSKKYPLGILSNTNRAHVEFFEEHYDFFPIFKARIYSCQVGVRKPEREIFDLALQALDAAPEQSLFVDDLEQNVLAARNLGWNAIQCSPDTDLENEMLPYGVTR